MSFQFKSAHSNLHFDRHKIIKLPDKILMENCLFIRKSIQLNLQSIFNHWFAFSSDSHNYEIFSSSKGLLKLTTVNTKKDDISSHLLHDPSTNLY